MKLSAADHQALRSAGFTPLGPVFGNHVRRAVVGRLDCGATVSPAQPQEEVLTSAVDDALGQLKRKSLHADGVIGIKVTEKQPVGRATEVSVTGVAVRADGDVRPQVPFLTDLDGRDFAKLVHSGWVPCGLALGIAAVVAHHVEQPFAIGTSLANRELLQHSAVVRDVQQRARAHLRLDCKRLYGAGLVLGQATVRMREPHCWMNRLGQKDNTWRLELPWSPPAQGERELHGRDLYAEAVFTATAIVRFGTPVVAPLTIVPVSAR
ncbi:hypothetical protein SK854_05845 [Lentzea sp. BCCO 10_0061]|uniref:Uncharacterized protein n=1 Tax=Lentzea sokolovensis TaxID=3095429 RepID=A0ABU4UQ52_9PSEU|nr:hypothetical protein [Lentzea sp. BCCO 10_0061]MDX8141625.1 hypothetical protein [Lentzea sp. BCCO 10_0061]